MSRTRRKIPHWLKKSEQLDLFWNSIGRVTHNRYLRKGSTNMSDRQKIVTGNFDMSDHERSEDIERRQHIRCVIEEHAAKEDDLGSD